MSAIAAPALLNFKELAGWATANRESYATACPFPHAVTPSFLEPEVLARAIAEYPSPEELSDWNRMTVTDEQGRPVQIEKLHHMNEYRFGPTLRGLLHELNSARFLVILEQLTGIKGLIPDPHFQGAGLHQYLPGALLGVHSDFNFHPYYGLDRRLNLLLYLNDGWQPEWGGELELWERDMSRCAKKVVPASNTCLVFSTTKDSFHGMPDPLRCPQGVTRKSIALYYYSNGRPENERYSVSKTLWKKRPGQDV
jgi:2OG-Fe(II) oxygenase superfamily